MREFLRLKDLVFNDHQTIDRQQGQNKSSSILNETLIVFVEDEMNDEEALLLAKRHQHFNFCQWHDKVEIATYGRCEFLTMMMLKRYIQVRTVQRLDII